MASSSTLVACEGCDLLHRSAPLPRGTRAWCARCGAELDLVVAGQHEHALPLALAGALLFVVANLSPFMSFGMRGLVEQNTVASGLFELARQDYHGLALLVALTTIVAPALRLGSLLWVLIALRRGRELPGTRGALRLITRLREWAMLDVFLLSAVVAWVKLSDMATVDIGPGFWAFAALVLANAAASAAFDPHEAWDVLEPPP